MPTPGQPRLVARAEMCRACGLDEAEVIDWGC